MTDFWKNIPSQIDPVAFSLGSFDVLWYSLCYFIGLVTVYLLLYWRVRYDKTIKERFSSLVRGGLIENLFIFCFIGMLLGAKLGYIFFYDLPGFLSSPIDSILPFKEGSFIGFYGLSYHGALVGIIVFGFLFCKKNKLSFLELSDFVVPAIPLGYMWGRLGNFLNQELVGRPTEFLLGMNFPGEIILRHPSQLYESLGEGLLIFVLLWMVRNKKFVRGKILFLYILLYGAVRFFLEFFRQPDQQIGSVILGLTMGQLLCFVMIVVGFLFLIRKVESTSD